MTTAKKDLIHLSKPSEDRFLIDWIAGETDYPFGPCTGMQLYTAYLRWCRANGVRHPRESNQFLGHINRIDGWSNKPRHVYNNCHYEAPSKLKRIVMPPESLLQQQGCTKPDSKTQTQWLTDRVVTMQNVLEGDS